MTPRYRVRSEDTKTNGTIEAIKSRMMMMDGARNTHGGKTYEVLVLKCEAVDGKVILKLT
jgi:hypothetical protein